MKPGGKVSIQVTDRRTVTSPAEKQRAQPRGSKSEEKNFRRSQKVRKAPNGVSGVNSFLVKGHHDQYVPW